jgi:predicted small metal-binding protein
MAEENKSGHKTFKCADMGHKDCNWEVSGRSEDELMPQIERHGRERHGINNLDEDSKRRVRSNIRDRAA